MTFVILLSLYLDSFFVLFSYVGAINIFYSASMINFGE